MTVALCSQITSERAVEEASLRGKKIGGEHRAVRGLAIRRERERSVGGDGKAKLVELFAQHVLCDTRRGRIENGRVIAPKAVFPRAVVQGDVEEVAGRVVGVDHKVIVVVRIRKFDAVRGGKFRGGRGLAALEGLGNPAEQQRQNDAVVTEASRRLP